MTTTTVPRSIEELTAPWLSAGLAPRFPGIRVADVAVDDVLHGTATKVLLRLRYEPDNAAEAPATVCVKGAFGKDNPAMAVTGIYEREALFYRDIEALLPRPGPIPWFAEPDPGTGFGVVVL